MRRAIGLVLLGISIIGCGGGGDGGSSAYAVNRDVATDVAAHLCARVAACDGLEGATIEECEGDVAGEICGAVPCGDDFSGSEDDVAACLEDLDDYPCDAETFELPPACQSIIPQ